MLKTILLLCLVLVYFVVLGNSASYLEQNQTESTCGYQSCPSVEEGKLNIHLVAHTHDDVGWLKTIDQYYFGSQTSIAEAGVQYILDTVVSELLEDPARRFIYVETAFLWKWWLRQDAKVQENVRNLIDEGRLEIINGAWSMNDEAVTHYHSIIDHFTWGFRRLNDTFGPCARPHVGWQIDPFGHSREQASLYAQMGFDGVFFARLDYQDKSKRLSEKTAELIWQGSQSLGKNASLFTSVLYNHYSPPDGFCFDVLCDDDPFIDDPESPDYNVDEKVDLFLAFAENQTSSYSTNNIIVTMGDDFYYQNARMWFKNLDKLIRYTNARNGTTVNVIYSTPSCYLKAVNDVNSSYTVKTDDFFPYASNAHSFWTGYYTSRPTIKFFERMGNNYLQVCKQLSVLTGLESHDDDLSRFREAMGVMQHHDAVTGTEKQKVAEDYARILFKSMRDGENITDNALRKWIQNASNSDVEESIQFHSCFQLNISSCNHTEENSNFVVTLYNPLSQPLSTYVRLPVLGSSYIIKDYNGSELVTQIVPIPEPVLNIPGRQSEATNELVFFANNTPPLGYQSYYVSENTTTSTNETSNSETATYINNELINVTIDSDGNIRAQWSNGTDVQQSFHYYEGFEGNDEVSTNRSSGAYIFRPKSSSAENFTTTGSQKIIKGPLVEEIHQYINDWVSQVIRVYNGEDHVEFDWLIGPVPSDDLIGKEIITKYSSGLESEATFYTDSNGREMLKRIRDYRPTWDLELEEPVAGNYYPVSTKISINDTEKELRLSVLTDRSQGGSSLHDGEIELMLHRRLFYDDGLGVGEVLNETAFGKGLVARGQHYVIGGSTAQDADSIILKEKNLALRLSLRPWTLISPANNISFEEWSQMNKMQDTGIAKNLPPNIHILTLEPWKNDTVLLRLEHMFEIGEDAQLSQPVEVNIQDLFTTFSIESIHETTLGGNQWLEELNRLEWQAESNEIERESANLTSVSIEDDAINILLNPMQIRTFIIQVSQLQ